MSARTIADMWATYQGAVLPDDAPPIQVQETRRAFYAGAHILLCDLPGMTEDVSEDAGVARLEALHRECQAFFVLVAAGRA